MIVCVMECYTNETPSLCFFDTEQLRNLGGEEEEFANKLETEDEIDVDYGVYGYQADMPTVEPPLLVDKALTMWCRSY